MLSERPLQTFNPSLPVFDRESERIKDFYVYYSKNERNHGNYMGLL